MKLGIAILSITFVVFIIITAGTFSTMNYINKLQTNLEKEQQSNTDLQLDIIEYKYDISFWKDKSFYWQSLYTNFEPKHIFHNETTYVSTPEYIYIDNAIFDVNRDNKVDYNDACEVLWYIQRGVTIIENWVFDIYGNPYEKLYDVNRDGCVNTIDVSLIWEYCD